MLYNYQNFLIEKNKMSLEEYLISQPFISKKNDKLLINIIYFKNNQLKEFMPDDSYLNYSRLFMYFVKKFIYNYKGYNSDILRLKKLLLIKSKDQYLGRMYNNRIIRNEKISDIVGYDMSKNTYDVYARMVYYKDKIFTEENFLKFYDKVKEITNEADKTENYTVDFLNKTGYFSDCKAANREDDLKGIDVICKYKDKKLNFQVKRVGNYGTIIFDYKDYIGDKKLPIDKYIIKISNTKVDLHYKNNVQYIVIWYKENMYIINMKYIDDIINHNNTLIYIIMNKKEFKVFDISNYLEISNNIEPKIHMPYNVEDKTNKYKDKYIKEFSNLKHVSYNPFNNLNDRPERKKQIWKGKVIKKYEIKSYFNHIYLIDVLFDNGVNDTLIYFKENKKIYDYLKEGQSFFMIY